MKGTRARLSILALVALMLGTLSCSDTNTSLLGSADDASSCVYHSDCPEGTSCDPATGTCQEDLFADDCLSDADCPAGYRCIERSGGQTVCSPDDSLIPDSFTDGDEDVDMFCRTNIDCPPGKECDLASGMCITALSDDDDDNDDDNDEDGDWDEESPPQDGDLDMEKDGGCQLDAQCPDGMICGPDLVCIPDCLADGCQYGTCNRQNGHCEFCDPLCESGSCCNFGWTYWYCGACCVPTCADGTVCSQGECVTPQCPRDCPQDNCHDCGPQTGWICEEDPACVLPDGDGEGSEAGVACLSTGSSCQQGMDECCSGICLLGTCL